MRWKTKPQIMVGTKRRQNKVAWWPKTTEDGKTIWLESYLSIKVYAGYQVWEEKEAWSQASTMWNEWHEKV